MDPAADVPPVSEVHLRTLSLALLSHIRQAQSEHGLKHGDYERYRLVVSFILII